MYYETLRGYVRAVDDVDLLLGKGEALGLAGESACGKTSIMLTILRLLPSNGRILGGSVNFEGEDILGLSDDEFRDNFSGSYERLTSMHEGRRADSGAYTAT